jgi:hypothetical protein
MAVLPRNGSVCPNEKIGQRTNTLKRERIWRINMNANQIKELVRDNFMKQLHQRETQDSQISIMGSLSEKEQNDIRDCARRSVESPDDWRNRENVMDIVDDVISRVKNRPSIVQYSLQRDELDHVLVPGKCIFTYGSWVSRVIESATCLDIALLADDAILATRDYAFRWLDDIEKVGMSPKGIPVYRLLLNTE